MKHPQLNPLGLEALVALCRYIRQHGNVTRAARRVASILSGACDDYDDIETDGAEQRRLDAAYHALRVRIEKLASEKPL